ncbi:F-box/LRR-repeat protein 12-like [Rutidosis leptorrhynchoides]|uniref:F-box/LRR-repeat protein 12-like n=1 Tax=Rutidosis leptorrhynchoides TaxID=125765 RepID=UPI003A98F396
MDRDSSIRRCCTRNLEINLDTWSYIYQKLDSHDDRTSFGLTCVSFRHIQNSSCKSLTVRCPDANIFASPIDSLTIEKLLSRHTQLQIFTLGCSGCRHISNSSLTPLLNYGSTLHSLNLDGCRFITDTGLKLVASACPLLSFISLMCAVDVTDIGLEILSKSCKSLKEVNLIACHSLTDDGIFFLNQNCRQLTALRISSCIGVHGVSFRECSSTLVRLEAFCCDLDSMGVSRIVSGGGLDYLNVGTIPLRCVPIDLKPIGFCSKLRYLSIAGRYFVEDDVIVKISRGCPLLQEWDLSECGRIGIPGWESVGLYCQNLEILHVSECDKLCVTGLLSIGAGCKRLSVIFINERRMNPDAVDLFRLQRPDVKIKTHCLFNYSPSWAFITRGRQECEEDTERVRRERGHLKFSLL